MDEAGAGPPRPTVGEPPVTEPTIEPVAMETEEPAEPVVEPVAEPPSGALAARLGDKIARTRRSI